MTKFERRMEDLEAYCKEYGCDKREALEAEFTPMSDDELMKAYLIM